FGIKRRIACKYHVVCAKKRQTAKGGRQGSENRGIRIKHFEIVQRTHSQLLQQQGIVHCGSSRAELIPSWANTAFEKWNHATTMMRNDLDIGMPVEQL